MRVLQGWKGVLLPILGGVFLCLGLIISSPNIVSSLGSVGDGDAGAVDLPWIFYQVKKNNLLAVEADVSWYSPRVWQVIPDDFLREITVNGEPVSLAEIPPQALRDYAEGFKIDLSGYLVNGKNHIEFRFDNGWGPGGLDIRPVKSWLALVMFFVGFSLFLVWFGRLFNISLPAHLLLLVALIPILSYWQETNWTTRSHDVGGDTGHYGYVKYVSDNHALPQPNQGWAFYHPPVYYVIGAAVFSLSEALNVSTTESLQALSVLFWLVFLVSSIATLRLFLRNNVVVYWTAVIALVFWPSGIIRSVGIGNDVPLYACIGIGTWFMCQWWKTGRRSLLVWAAVFSALALLIKSNGIVLAAALGSLLAVRFFFRRDCKKCKTLLDGMLFGTIVLSGFIASFAVRIYFYLKGELSHWLVSNAGGLGDSLRVPVSLKSFTPLDLPTFLTQPFINSYDDSTGRGNFWNFLMRSSLTGEFSFDGKLQVLISYAWGAALVVLFFVALVDLRRLSSLNFARFYRYMPIIVLLVLWLLSMIVFRIQLPFSCSNDFRYITPMLMPLLLVWAMGGRLQRYLLGFISATSVIFFLGL